MMVYQEKIVPLGSLPVLASEPPDVLLSQRTWPWMVVWIAAVAVIIGLVGAPLIPLGPPQPAERSLTPGETCAGLAHCLLGGALIARARALS